MVVATAEILLGKGTAIAVDSTALTEMPSRLPSTQVVLLIHKILSNNSYYSMKDSLEFLVEPIWEIYTSVCYFSTKFEFNFNIITILIFNEEKIVIASTKLKQIVLFIIPLIITL